LLQKDTAHPVVIQWVVVYSAISADAPTHFLQGESAVLLVECIPGQADGKN
jgi:hypothetical protein